MSEWRKVVADADVREGAPFGAEIDGVRVGVFRVEDEIVAIENVCTHAFALLTNGFQEGCLIECPLHAGFFDLRTGKAQGPPLERDVLVYRTKIEDGWVYVELPSV